MRVQSIIMDVFHAQKTLGLITGPRKKEISLVDETRFPSSCIGSRGQASISNARQVLVFGWVVRFLRRSKIDERAALLLSRCRQVVLGPTLEAGIKNPPSGVSEGIRLHLECPQYKMTIPVDPRFTVAFSQDLTVSVLVRRKDSNRVACIINKSTFGYTDRTSNRFMAFEYLDFSPLYPFISNTRAWISLLFMDKDQNEGVIDVFGIELDFCDAANSKEEVLWLIDMLDWK
ncbi:hypothetical protein NL676_005249 [Syzygium grande]|nr:hypothetical protein NL676_005249 [Syzygium grande]